MQLGAIVENTHTHTHRNPSAKDFHSVMEAERIHLGPSVFILIFLFLLFFFFPSWRLLLLMYYLYSGKLGSEDSSILQISFLILSIKNARAAGFSGLGRAAEE